MNQIKLGAVLSYLSLGVSNIIVLSYTPFMLRMLGQAEYGLYSLVFSVVSALVLLDCGFGPALVRYIVKYKAAKQYDEIAGLIGMFAIIYTVIGFVCLLLGILLYANIDFIFKQSMEAEEIQIAKYMVAIIAIYISLNFLFSIFSSVIVAYERFVFLKLTQILRSLLMPALMIPLLFLGYKSVAMAVTLVMVGVIIWVINAVYCVRKLKLSVKFVRFDFLLLKEILLFSGLAFMKILLERFFWSTGQFIEGAIAGTIAVALLSIALQMNGYYQVFANAINGLFLPRMIAMAHNKVDGKEFSDYFIRISRLQMHFLGLIMCIYLLFGKDFILLWAGKDYEVSYYLSLIIMIPYAIPLTQNLGKTLLEACNKQKYHVIVLSVSCASMILLSLLWGKKYPVYGIAIAIGVSIVLSEVLLLNFFYKKKMHLDIGGYYKELLKMIFLMGCPTVAFFYFMPSFLIKNYMDLLKYLLLFLSIYIFFVPLMLNRYERNLLLSFVKRRL